MGGGRVLQYEVCFKPDKIKKKSKLLCFDVEFWWTEMTLTAVVTVGALFDLEIV